MRETEGLCLISSTLPRKAEGQCAVSSQPCEARRRLWPQTQHTRTHFSGWTSTRFHNEHNEHSVLRCLRVSGSQTHSRAPSCSILSNPETAPEHHTQWALPPTLVCALCGLPSCGLQLNAKSHSRASEGSASDITNCSAAISAHPPKWMNKNQHSKGPP